MKSKIKLFKSKSNFNKTKFIKLSVLVFIFFVAVAGVFLVFNSQASSRMSRRGSSFPVSKLSVLSWNMRYGGQRVGYDVQKYADLIRLTSADIVFIQETYNNQIDDLARKAGMNYKFTTTVPASRSVSKDPAYISKYGSNPQYGIAILSKYPLGSASVIDLPSSDEKRKMMYVNTWINGTGVRLANTHLTAELNSEGRKSRAESASKISKIIASDSVFTIFGGDLNANISELSAIKSKFFVVSNDGASTPSEVPVKRFDYVGIANAPINLAGISDEVLINTYSDHRPVLYSMIFKR